MDRKSIITGCLGALLLGTAATAVVLLNASNQHVKALESELKALKLHAKRSAVDRSISRQMEEIAYQQQAVSERRREEALQQTLIAQDMTRRSETERQNALKAQATAEASEREAREAYRLAEQQRQVAEQQRLQAEYAKRVADTLNYVSMSRSLGSQAYTLYQAGDTVTGNMLAYISYLFSHDYHGDLYSPNVFQSLILASKGQRVWSIHNGGISRVEMNNVARQLITVSTYGEIVVHDIRNHQLFPHRLFQNSEYDFRDAYASFISGKTYVVSRTGHLVIIDNGRVEVRALENVAKPFKLSSLLDEKGLLVVGEKSLTAIDFSTDKILGTRQLDFTVRSVGRVDYKPLLFDTEGRMHVVNTLDSIETSSVPVTGEITAFASSKEAQLSAYGTHDGVIYLIDGKGRTRQLVGHRSRVTKMKFSEKRLYSSSLDGQLLLWVVDDNQIKPIQLFQGDTWLLDFTYDSNRDYIWIGQANGNLVEYIISIDMMKERIRKNLQRDFTEEEWNYYIGNGIPYRSLMGD